MVNRLKKVQHGLHLVIMMYYGINNSISIVQFKKIIINFISIIDLQILQCFDIHCLKKAPFWTLSGSDELMPRTFGENNWKKTVLQRLSSKGNGTLRSLRFHVYKPGNTFKITRSCYWRYENMQRCKVNDIRAKR